MERLLSDKEIQEFRKTHTKDEFACMMSSQRELRARRDRALIQQRLEESHRAEEAKATTQASLVWEEAKRRREEQEREAQRNIAVEEEKKMRSVEERERARREDVARNVQRCRELATPQEMEDANERNADAMRRSRAALSSIDKQNMNAQHSVRMREQRGRMPAEELQARRVQNAQHMREVRFTEKKNPIVKVLSDFNEMLGIAALPDVVCALNKLDPLQATQEEIDAAAEPFMAAIEKISRETLSDAAIDAAVRSCSERVNGEGNLSELFFWGGGFSCFLRIFPRSSVS